MATLDSFREAAGEPIRLDLANGYIADIRLNSGDINGRTITVELTDNGTPITTTTGITAALAYNTSPGGDLGDRVTMTAVNGAPTATFRAAVPRKALLKSGRILLGIEISKDGNKTCSRNFYGLVERAVFDGTSPDVDDKLGRIEQLILDAEKATGSANTAAGKATTAADAANTAASAAGTATGKANTATAAANTAANAANTAATKANNAASSATTAASNANDKATTAQTAASAASAAAVKANDAAAKAASAAGDARDAAEAARTSVIEYAQLSEDCKAKIAASAAAGVAFATRDEIDAQYETVIEPVLGGDGLADIRIRRNMTTISHDAGDGQTAWTEYTADEAYTVRDLTQQEAIEQADSIWLDCLQASKTDSQRLSELEASSLDQDEALAEIYQLLAGGEA